MMTKRAMLRAELLRAVKLIREEIPDRHLQYLEGVTDAIASIEDVADALKPEKRS